MPLVDPKMKFKADLNKQLNDAKKVFTRENYNNNSSNAVKLSSKLKRTPSISECIMEALQAINSACQSGEYYASCEVNNKMVKNVANYYAGKGYIVFYKVSQQGVENKYWSRNNNLFIFWVGSKKWIESKGFTYNKDTAPAKAWDFISKVLNDESSGSKVESIPAGLNYTLTYDQVRSKFLPLIKKIR